MIKRYISAIILIISLIFSVDSSAQLCSMKNTAFKEGEVLTFDLYFKFGILNSKAGISKMLTEEVTYDSMKVYKVTLLAQSVGAASKFFNVNDTLSSFLTKDLRPLKFYKNAEEGKDHTIEIAKYKYVGDEVKINTQRVKNGEKKFNVDYASKSCIYDLMSVVPYCRNLDYSKMKKGDTVRIEFLSGKRKVKMEIEHSGTENVKANNDKKYNCIKLVMSIGDDAFTDKEESMKVFITNDANRMPVRIETKLKHGSTRAILKDYTGNRYTIKD